MRKFLLLLLFITSAILPIYCQSYTMSQNGIELIKHYEGLTLKRENGYIGYGHKIKHNEKYSSITVQEAESILLSDIEITNSLINELLKPLNDSIVLSQGFIDGFGSFIYNCGVGNVRKSQFYHRLIKCKTHDDLEFAISIIPFTYCGLKGLKKRRKSEHHLMKYNKLNFKNGE